MEVQKLQICIPKQLILQQNYISKELLLRFHRSKSFIIQCEAKRLFAKEPAVANYLTFFDTFFKAFVKLFS